MSDFHSLHQTDLPVQVQILNISMNMARIARWVENSYETKADFIERFISQTESYLNDLSVESVSPKFTPTLVKFTAEFKKLKSQSINDQNRMIWSERALTWADILQLRAKFA